MQNDTLAQNAALDPSLQAAITPIFGNLAFQIMPSQTGEVSDTFGIVPYVSVEGLVHEAQVGAQTSPSNIMSGQNQGQQNIQGSYTIQDSNGLPRMVMGYSPGGF